MIMRWVKRVLFAAVLIAIAVVLVLSMLPRPLPVETARVDRGAVEVTIDEDGRARVQDRHVVVAPMSGVLARPELRAGDAVEADQVIARLSPLPSPLLDARSRSELEGRLAIATVQERQAKAQVARARVAAEFAKKDLDRARTLAGSSAITGDELDRRTLATDLAAREVRSAELQAQVAAKEVETAQAMIVRWDQGAAASASGVVAAGGDDEVQVRAPLAGRVLRVFVESEGVVQVGTPLFELGDPGRLEIAIEALTADAVRIPDGAPVVVDAWGGPPLTGRVRRVEPSARTRVSALGVEEQRVTVLVDLVDPPASWDKLGDGWRVEARITVWRGDGRVRAPLGALFRDGSDWAVFVVADGVARRRVVTIGQRSTTWAEVTAGLAEGDVVVMHPSERVKDGGQVAASP